MCNRKLDQKILKFLVDNNLALPTDTLYTDKFIPESVNEIRIYKSCIGGTCISFYFQNTEFYLRLFRPQPKTSNSVDSKMWFLYEFGEEGFKRAIGWNKK